MTRLEWSAAIGKRVQAGTWADHAVPTLDSARAALAEAGDTFGLKAGRREVAAQLTRGLTSKEIGRELGISHRTVEIYRARLMRKHRAHTTAELVQQLLAGP